MRSPQTPPRHARAVQVLLTVALLTSSTSCFVDQHTGQATVHVSIDLGQQRFAIVEDDAFENQAGIRDANGLLHLDEVPAFMEVWVTGADMNKPTIATWPDERIDLDSPTISLDVVVPAGDQRKFTFLVYVFDGETVRTWSDDGSIERDLPGGLTSELPVTLELVPTGSLNIELTGPNAQQTSSVLVVDGEPAIAYPPLLVEDGPLVLDDAPIGRPLSFRIVTYGGEVASPTPPVTLDEPGQIVDVEVQVP